MLIFHNPRCRKSRETLEIIKSKGVEPELRLYLTDAPNKKELQEVLKKLSMKPSELVRKKESIFVELYKGKDLSEEDYLQAMLDHPKLIERPIVISGDKAILGRPPENVLDLL